MTSRERILSAAIPVFARKGRFGAHMEDIAALAHINKAMIYYHFKNKDGLYQAIISQLFDKISGIINEHASINMPPDEKLFTMIRSLSTFIYELGDDMRHVMVWEVAFLKLRNATIKMLIGWSMRFSLVPNFMSCMLFRKNPKRASAHHNRM